MHAWRPFRNGLTAVLADDLTREAIVSAIRRRKTYVTTGSRTLLEFHMNDASIGEIVEQPLTDRRNFHVRVTAESDLRRVEIIRNGETVVSQATTSTEHIMDWEDRKRKRCRGLSLPSCYIVGWGHAMDFAHMGANPGRGSGCPTENACRRISPAPVDQTLRIVAGAGGQASRARRGSATYPLCRSIGSINPLSS